MTIKEKFESIDQGKLKSEQVAFLQKIKTATKDFTLEDAVTNEKIGAALDKMISAFKESNPDAIKTKQEEKKEAPEQKAAPEKKVTAKRTPAKRTGQTPAAKKAAEAKLAKEKEAEAKAQQEKAATEKKAEKKVKSEMEKLLQFVRRRKELKNISGTDIMRDARRQALPSGRRTSKEGNVYYEYDENRTDRTQGSKSGYYLENGGAFGAGHFAKGGSIKDLPSDSVSKKVKYWASYIVTSETKANDEINYLASFMEDNLKLYSNVFWLGGYVCLGFNYKGTKQQLKDSLVELSKAMGKKDISGELQELNETSKEVYEYAGGEDDEYANGGAFGAGHFADGGDVEERLVGSFYYDSRKDKTFRVIYSDKNKISIEYFDRNKNPIGKIEDVTRSDFDYLTSMGAWGKWKQPYFENGGAFGAGHFADGGRVKNKELISSELFYVKENSDFSKAIDELIPEINKSLIKKGLSPITTNEEFDKESDFPDRVYVDNETIIRIWDSKTTKNGAKFRISVFKEEYANGGAFGAGHFADGGALGENFKEVIDLGAEQYYTRHFGTVGTDSMGDVELVVVAKIMDLEDYVSEDELPEDGKFQLDITLVPYPKFLSNEILESANDEDSSSISDDSVVNVVNYAGGLNYNPQVKVNFETQKEALDYLMSKELKDRINADGSMSGFIMDRAYNRAGQTNWGFLDYLMGVTDKPFENGGAFGASHFAEGGGVSDAPIGVMREIKGKSISVPVTGQTSTGEINRFIEYVFDYYDEQYSKQQVRTAVNKYLKDLSYEQTFGGGDSLDRERVFDKYLYLHSIEKNYKDGYITKMEFEDMKKAHEKKFANGGAFGAGHFADGGDVEERLVGSFYYDSRKDKTFRVIYSDKNKISIQYFDRSKNPVGKIEDVTRSDFDYLTSMGAWAKYKQPYFENGGAFGAGHFAKGGSIKNQYEGKHYSDVWDDMWSVEQKYHFLSDHKNEIGFDEEFYNQMPKTTKRIQSSKGSEIGFLFKDSDKIVATRASELPRYVKFALEKHIREGQYANGGAFGAGNFKEGGSLATMSYVEPTSKKGYYELTEKHGIFPSAGIVESDDDDDDDEDYTFIGRVSYLAKSSQDDSGIKGMSREYVVSEDEEEDAKEEIEKMFFEEMSNPPFNRKKYEVLEITFKNKKMAMGGFTQMDLAGHLGGGYDFGRPTYLNGFTGTQYTGLVGETGALSSGEMFENGGAFGAGHFKDGGKLSNLGYASLGNGMTVYDRNKDFKNIAHVSEQGEITFYDKNLSEAVKNEILEKSKSWKKTGFENGGAFGAGHFADGGEFSPEEINDSAKVYADASRWTTKPTVEGFEKKINEFQLLRTKLDNKEIRPYKIIGTGFKPEKARKVAYDYIDRNIAIYKRAIEILKESKTNPTKIYVDHDDIVSVTLKLNKKTVTLKGSDVLNGANLEKGGELSKIANYVKKADVLSVKLKNGETVKPLNGYWVKKDATTENGETAKTTKSRMVVSKLSEIPKLKESLDAGTVTYRGLGMGKLSDDFYDLAGTTGTRIKVSGKEYFITDEDFNSISRDSDGKLIIRFDAPNRKMENGGAFGAGNFSIFSGKRNMIIADGYETEEDAKKEMYNIFETTSDFSLQIIKNKKSNFAAGGAFGAGHFADGGKLTKSEVMRKMYKPSGDYFFEQKGNDLIVHLTSRDAGNSIESLMDKYDVKDNGRGYYGSSYVLSRKNKMANGGAFGAGHFMAGGNIDAVMQDASQSYVNYYLGEGAAQGIYAKGGMLSANERYVLEMAGLTGLRKEAILNFISENGLTESEVLNIVIGLGRRQIKGTDVSTAVVGTKNNKYAKEVIAFAKSDKALKAEFGGSFGAYN